MNHAHTQMDTNIHRYVLYIYIYIYIHTHTKIINKK